MNNEEYAYIDAINRAIDFAEKNEPKNISGVLKTLPLLSGRKCNYYE